MMRHCPDWYTDIEVARYYLSRYCLIHLNNDLDKVRLLAFMTRKLFRLSQNRGMVDNPDSPENHEALLPGTVKAFLKRSSWMSHPILQNIIFIEFRPSLPNVYTRITRRRNEPDCWFDEERI